MIPKMYVKFKREDFEKFLEDMVKREYCDSGPWEYISEEPYLAKDGLLKIRLKREPVYPGEVDIEDEYGIICPYKTTQS